MKYNKILETQSDPYCFKSVVQPSQLTEEVVETSGIFGINEEENDPRLNFSELHIDASSPSSEFYVNLLRRSPDNITHTLLDNRYEHVLSVCYGSIEGKHPPLYTIQGERLEYEYLDSLRITPTLANYLRFRNILLPQDDPVFSTSEGDMTEFFALVFPRHRVKTMLDPGNFRIKLGSLVLIDNSDAEESPLLHRKQVYEIVEATLENGQYRILKNPLKKHGFNSYGLFYPGLGILLLDAKMLRDAVFSPVVVGTGTEQSIAYASRILVKEKLFFPEVTYQRYLSSLTPPYLLTIENTDQFYVAYSLRFLISGEDESLIQALYGSSLRVNDNRGRIFEYFETPSGNNFRDRILRQLTSAKRFYSETENYFWSQSPLGNRVPNDDVSFILFSALRNYVSYDCFSGTESGTATVNPLTPITRELDKFSDASLTISQRLTAINNVFRSFGVLNLNCGFALFLQALFNHNIHFDSSQSWKTYLQFRNEHKTYEEPVYLKIDWNEFNYSNNTTYVKDELGNFYHIDFIRDSKTYITTIGLYDDKYNLLAVAKLPNPLPKDFSKEYFVKVRIRK